MIICPENSAKSYNHTWGHLKWLDPNLKIMKALKKCSQYIMEEVYFIHYPLIGHFSRH